MIRLLLFTSILLAAADLDRGKELYEQAKYSEAETELQKVVAENGDNAQARLYLGKALMALGKFDDAAPHLQKADELQASGETKLGLAHLYVHRKELDKAEAALKDASGDDLEYVRGVYNLHRQNYEESAKDLESYLDKKKGNAYAHYYAGLAYNGAKRPDKMLTHFEMFLRMKPDAPEARKVRSVVRAR
jgi:tetratricopeptide (TPR) repeat protein